MSLEPFLNRVKEPDFRLSPRAQNRVDFVNRVMSTSTGRILAALTLGALCVAGGCAIKDQFDPSKPSLHSSK